VKVAVAVNVAIRVSRRSDASRDSAGKPWGMPSKISKATGTPAAAAGQR
jgi:hypothetical protein